MKVVILAGGFGTRISDVDENIPKPLIKINGKPLLWHIMTHYSKYGLNDFVIALGYKGEKIKEYFLNLNKLSSDLEINIKNGHFKELNKQKLNWKVKLIDTGLDTLTGGRLKRLEKILKNENEFHCTYGDGLSDVNINKLTEYHKKKKSIATVTAVHPQARFGELDIKKNGFVNNFAEKPQLNQGWINGGFFIFNKKFFKYIDNDLTILERDPLENLAKSNNLTAFKHSGFWQCVDTRRDKELLEKYFRHKLEK